MLYAIIRTDNSAEMTGNIKTGKVRFVFCSGFGSHYSKIITAGSQITQQSLNTIKYTD